MTIELNVDIQSLLMLLKHARRVRDTMLELQLQLHHRPHLSALTIHLQHRVNEQEEIIRGIENGAYLIDGTKRKLEEILIKEFGLDQYSGPDGPPFERGMDYLATDFELTELEQAINEMLQMGISTAIFVEACLFLWDVISTISLQFFWHHVMEYQATLWHRLGTTAADEWWRILIPGGMVVTFWQSHAEATGQVLHSITQDGLHRATNLIEHRLGSRKEDFQRILTGVLLALESFGVFDEAILSKTSVLDVRTRQKRYKHFQNEVRTKHGLLRPAPRMNRPRKISDLVLHLAEIDALGGTDEAVVKILQDRQEEGRIIVMIPSTQAWSLDSTTPNDLLGNLELMAGSSAMVKQVDLAVQKSFPDPEVLTEVLVMGFSQGGLASTAFASHFGDKYPVTQVITFGAPVAGFNRLPNKTKMLSLEFKNDPVPKLDGGRNPADKNRITYEADLGNHNIHDYYSFTDQLERETLEEVIGEDFTPMTEMNIKNFLDKDYRTITYFIRRPNGGTEAE